MSAKSSEDENEVQNEDEKIKEYERIMTADNKEAQPHGIILTLNATSPEHLDGTVFLTEFSTVKCPELDTEIQVGKGETTTVEGMLRDMGSKLESHKSSEEGDEVEVFLENLENLITETKEGNANFELTIECILGAAYLEGSTVTTFERTPEQEAQLWVAGYQL